MIDLIEKKEPPEKICKQLGICKEAIPEPNDAKCDFCVLVVDAIEYFIEDPHTEQEIIAHLDWVCKKLVPKYVNVCDEIVSCLQKLFFPSPPVLHKR